MRMTRERSWGGIDSYLNIRVFGGGGLVYSSEKRMPALAIYYSYQGWSI